MLITVEQCRAARGLSGLSQSELADSAHIGRATLSEFERGDRVPTYNNLQAIRAALEAEGIAFIPANGGGLGVRLLSAGKNDPIGKSVLSRSLCRAARGIVGLSQEELAVAASFGRSIVTDFERGARVPSSSNLDVLRKALEAAGVSFIEADGEAGPGVRLRE